MGSLDVAASNTTPITQIDEQIESHRQAIIALSFRRNSLSVMQRIPVDVLVYIFLWYKVIAIHECELSMKSRPAGARKIQIELPLNDDLETVAEKLPSSEKGRHPAPWITPSQVCSHWRQVALDCGPFWSTVFLNDIQWTEKLLRLSGSSELEVLPDPRLFCEMPRGAGEVEFREKYQRSQGYAATVNDCLRLVMTNASSRISSLRVYTTTFPSGFDFGSPVTAHSLASLKNLSIVQSRKDMFQHSLDDGEIDNWATALIRHAFSDLECRLTRFDVFLACPSRNWIGVRSAHITHLRISYMSPVRGVRYEPPSLAGLVAMLRGFPSLRELVLQNLMDDGSAAPSDTITLPHLTHIETLDCPLRAVASILDPLRVTSLAKARVRCGNNEPPHGAAAHTVADGSSGENARRDINSLLSSLNRLFSGPGNGDVPSKGKSRATSSSRRSLLISFDDNGAGTVGLAFAPNDDISMTTGHGDDGVGPGMFTYDDARVPESPPSGNISSQTSLQISLAGIGHLQQEIPTFLVEKELVEDIESVVLHEDFRFNKRSVAARDVYTPWLQMLSSLPRLRSLALYIGPKDAQEVALESLDVGSQLLSDGVEEERGSRDNEVGFKGLANFTICFPRSPYTEFLRERLANPPAPLPLTSVLHAPQTTSTASHGVPPGSAVPPPLTSIGSLGHPANAPALPPSLPVLPQNNIATAPSNIPSSSSGAHHGGNPINGGPPPPPALAPLTAANSILTAYPGIAPSAGAQLYYAPPQSYGTNLSYYLSALGPPSTTSGLQSQSFPANPPTISSSQSLSNHIPANHAGVFAQPLSSPNQLLTTQNSGGHGAGGRYLIPSNQASRFFDLYMSRDGHVTTRRRGYGFEDRDGPSPASSSVRSLPEVLRARQYHGYRVQNLTFVPVEAPEYNWLMEEWAEGCVTLDVADEVLLDPGFDGI
ncbi:hypothetical protein V5O48_011923 [Marasmius crinis-equi]|uniref:F-box domain-containing protein n=1 Tax=Marasmius crinis-equi TaxID=585013 RepID=A0ABR3F4S4_9AGAR